MEILLIVTNIDDDDDDDDIFQFKHDLQINIYNYFYNSLYTNYKLLTVVLAILNFVGCMTIVTLMAFISQKSGRSLVVKSEWIIPKNIRF